MLLNIKRTLLTGLGLALVSGVALAASPSIVNTSWNLTGKFSGKAKVSCQIGGSHSVPISGKKNLSATIVFEDGEVADDNEGTFSMSDGFTPTDIKQITGRWIQTGAKLALEFDSWYDSPMMEFAFALAQVPDNFDFSQAGVSGSANGFEITKQPTLTGTINAKGNKIKIAESFGFKFDASASAQGSSNSCSYSFSSLGRSYTGTP